jgi:hypothetical protein
VVTSLALASCGLMKLAVASTRRAVSEIGILLQWITVLISEIVSRVRATISSSRSIMMKMMMMTATLHQVSPPLRVVSNHVLDVVRRAVISTRSAWSARSIGIGRMRISASQVSTLATLWLKRASDLMVKLLAGLLKRLLEILWLE